MSSKISIKSLENARRNTKEFAKLLSKSGDTGSSFFGGYPKSMRWLNAACEFHKTNDISDAIDSLEEGFQKRKNTAANRREMAKLIQALGNYETEVDSRSLSFIKSREPISIYLNRDLRISGQIPLIFMTPSGFSAYFVEKENAEWQEELRFPVVQSFLATKVFDTTVKNVEVGYIDYFSGTFYQKSYSSRKIKESLEELKDLGDTIVSYL